MDIIDRDWIAARLATRKHGAQRELADAIGLKPDMMSKVMAGTRQISAAEAARIAEFFRRDQLPPQNVEPSLGFAESQAEPWLPPQDIDANNPIPSLMKSAEHGQTYRITRASPAFAFLKGDILVIDLKRPPKDGDVILVGLTDTTTSQTVTLVRRYQAGFGITPDAGEPAQVIQLNTEKAAWRGTITSMFRPEV
jgi:DNA-binding transcriptional regulator YdaS (Cro superfamily)